MGFVKNFISSKKVAGFAVIINVCSQNILICLCTIKQDKNWTLESTVNQKYSNQIFKLALNFFMFETLELIF